MATTPSVRRLSRFSRTERALHWVHASAFLMLLASGLCLYLPSLAELIGRRPLLKDIHVYTALAWLAAIAIVLLAGDRRRLLATAREIDSFDADDLAWLKRRRAAQAASMPVRRSTRSSPPHSPFSSPSPGSSSGTASATTPSGSKTR